MSNQSLALWTAPRLHKHKKAIMIRDERWREKEKREKRDRERETQKDKEGDRILALGPTPVTASKS